MALAALCDTPNSGYQKKVFGGGLCEKSTLVLITTSKTLMAENLLIIVIVVSEVHQRNIDKQEACRIRSIAMRPHKLPT